MERKGKFIFIFNAFLLTSSFLWNNSIRTPRDYSVIKRYLPSKYGIWIQKTSWLHTLRVTSNFAQAFRLLYICHLWGPLMVAQWLKYCATNRKVAGSINGIGREQNSGWYSVWIRNTYQGRGHSDLISNSGHRDDRQPWFGFWHAQSIIVSRIIVASPCATTWISSNGPVGKHIFGKDGPQTQADIWTCFNDLSKGDRYLGSPFFV
jgi:hypothetical protein